MLDLGLDCFGLEIGILSQIQGDEYQVLHCLHGGDIPLEDGACFSLDRTYCALTMAADGPVGIECMGETLHHTHPAYRDFQLESYLGTPVFVGGKVFGTLNFSSPIARDRKFHQVDFDAVQLMAAWLGSELARLQKEEQLRRAEERFRLALDASPGAMVIMDQSGTIAHVNIEALRLFDYSYEQIIGREVDVLLPETSRSGADVLAEWIREAVSCIDQLQIPVTISIGAATVEGSPLTGSSKDTATDLLTRADVALYRAKEMGRNRVALCTGSRGKTGPRSEVPPNYPA